MIRKILFNILDQTLTTLKLNHLIEEKTALLSAMGKTILLQYK